MTGANGVALTIEQVIAQSKRKRAAKVRRVQLDGIGMVYLVPANPIDVGRIVEKASGGDLPAQQAATVDMIAACWADAEGNHVESSPEDIQQLAEAILQEDMDTLLATAQELCGLSSEDKDAEKRLESPTDAS